jgi:ribonuclease R
MRIKRGAFMFETPEAKLILNEKGYVKDIVLRTRQDAECLIEEFMLAANECVAETMTWLDVPFIYRVHEEPKEDKIGKFIQILNNFNYEFKVKGKTSKAMSKALQEVLIELEESNSDIQKTIINNTLLRSMMKAKYLETNLGHYGLASECYTHFTSPIRRYPDLLVHRLIKHYMLNKPQIESNFDSDFFESKVRNASDMASKKERLAESLERDATNLKKCEYMESYIHEIFDGVISSITNFGIYVTLANTVEGLIRYEDMKDDYYDIDELNARVVGRRIGNIYQMGDLVRVRLVDVNTEKRQISFKLIKKIK